MPSTPNGEALFRDGRGLGGCRVPLGMANVRRMAKAQGYVHPPKAVLFQDTLDASSNPGLGIASV